jgi:hypothetical protein
LRFGNGKRTVALFIPTSKAAKAATDKALPPLGHTRAASILAAIAPSQNSIRLSINAIAPSQNSIRLSINAIAPLQTTIHLLLNAIAPLQNPIRLLLRTIRALLDDSAIAQTNIDAFPEADGKLEFPRFKCKRFKMRIATVACAALTTGAGFGNRRWVGSWEFQ